MSIVKKVDGEKIVFAENNIVVDHNHLANREAYGAHPISAIRKLPEKLNALKQKTTELQTHLEKTDARIEHIVNSNVDIEDIEKLQSNIDKVESATKKITLVENGDDTLTFTNYDGKETNVRSGHQVDNDTIVLNDDEKITLNKVYLENVFKGVGTSIDPIQINLDETTVTKNDQKLVVKALQDESMDSKVLTSKDIHDEFDAVNTEIGKVKDKTIADYNLLDNANKVQDDKLRDLFTRTKGIGGYLNAYNFGKATPTQDELTAYALTQIDSEDRSKIFNQTKVKNLFDDNIWVLTNTPDSTPAVFDWADVGKESVADANNDGLHGLVTGSNEEYECSVSALGTLSVNGLPELEQRIRDNFDDINYNIGDISDLQQAVSSDSGKVNNIIDVLKEHNQRIISEFDQVNEITGEISDLKEADKALDKKIQDIVEDKTQIAYNYRKIADATDDTPEKYISEFYAAGAKIKAGSGAIVIGADSEAGSYSTVIGHHSKSGLYDIIIGNEATRGDDAGYESAISIGNNAHVYKSHSIVIGDNAEASADGAIQLGSGTNDKSYTLKVFNAELLTQEGKIPNERLSLDLDNIVYKNKEQIITSNTTFTNFNLQVTGNKPIQMQAVENGNLLLQQINSSLGSTITLKTEDTETEQAFVLAAQKGNDSARLDLTHSGFSFDISNIVDDVEKTSSVVINSNVDVVTDKFLYNGSEVATKADLGPMVETGNLIEANGFTAHIDLDNTTLAANIQDIFKYLNNQNGGSLISLSIKTGADNIVGDVVSVTESESGSSIDTDYGQPILSANSFYYMYPEQIFANGNEWTICLGCKTNYPYGKGIVTLKATKNTTTGLFENATATLAGEAFYVYNGTVNRYYFQDINILSETLAHLTVRYTYYGD